MNLQWQKPEPYRCPRHRAEIVKMMTALRAIVKRGSQEKLPREDRESLEVMSHVAEALAWVMKDPCCLVAGVMNQTLKMYEDWADASRPPITVTSEDIYAYRDKLRGIGVDAKVGLGPDQVEGAALPGTIIPFNGGGKEMVQAIHQGAALSQVSEPFRGVRQEAPAGFPVQTEIFLLDSPGPQPRQRPDPQNADLGGQSQDLTPTLPG